jgi:hypothetical protein
VRWWGCGGELEGSENHLDYPLSEFGNSRVGMSDWEVGGGSKGDSGSAVATLTALGAFTSASSSFSSLSATPTPTGSGDESLKGY